MRFDSMYAERLEALRSELVRRNLDGFVIPLTDEHMSEYVGAYAQRLAWLTGFRGSAGTAVVLKDRAAIFVDGRYTLQVKTQVDPRYWSYEIVPRSTVAAWLRAHAVAGSRIGFDPWLHPKGWLTAARTAVQDKPVELVAVEGNPVDAIWRDRPGPSQAKLCVHPEALAGESSASKRLRITEWLSSIHADAVILSALDSIAWTFNIRGSDIDYIPVARAYAVLHADGSGALFVDPEKLTEEVVAHIGSGIRLHPYTHLAQYVQDFSNKVVAVDSASTVVAIYSALDACGARALEARDPTFLAKAAKNDREIAGHKAAQERDGLALARLLHWLSVEGAGGSVSELTVAARAQSLRREFETFRDLSFKTISAFGPNGAIVHYAASVETDRTLESGSLFLLDSGAQYVDGTTDVTRTIAVGAPTAEMQDRFTRVLKGHIALATAIFPEGTCGWQLDALARQYLWQQGLDYAHGTGHGVGAYLSVHEEPRVIQPRAAARGGDVPLTVGMILSNEPGYYKAGEYGIRTENLMTVVECKIPGSECKMLGFEVLTLAPIDRTLIDLKLLTAAEIAWIDAYHAKVAHAILPRLEGAERVWLAAVTKPLGSTHTDEMRRHNG